MGETIVRNSNPKELRGKTIGQYVRANKHKEQNRGISGQRAYPAPLMRLLHSRRRPNRLLEVYSLLERNAEWLSAEDINSDIKYVKRTLQGLLNKLVERKLVKKTRSLSDARITLFCAIPIEKILLRLK